jgi:hypothetical protein
MFYFRAIHNKALMEVRIQKLFGENDVSEILAEVSTTETNKRLENLCRKYQSQLKEEFNHQEQDGSLFTSAIAFRKGKKGPKKATIYFMVFGTTSMSILQNFKTAAQSVTQQGSELAFSDFFHFNGIVIPNGRKTTNEEEAETIYNHFQGQTVTLGEVKRWVIEETPYPYHARAIKVLENDKRLTVEPLDCDGRPMERSNKKMCFEISPQPNDPDTPEKTFGNLWVLRFA